MPRLEPAQLRLRGGLSIGVQNDVRPCFLKPFASCPTNNSVPPCSLGDTVMKGGALRATLNQDPCSSSRDIPKNCEARLPSRIDLSWIGGTRKSTLAVVR